jgi:hypothetical protein
MGQRENISKIHFFVSFSAAVLCFVWLAVTNHGGPAAVDGGTVVTYFPPAYLFIIIIGQLFAGIPFHVGMNVRVFSAWGFFTYESRPKMYILVLSIPGVLGVVMVIFGIVRLCPSSQ